MDAPALTDAFAPNDDPSWGRAMEIAHSRLNLSANVAQLFRAGWRGQTDTKEVIKLLGFSRLNIESLLDAAGVDTQNGADAAQVEQAIFSLGLKYCTVVLAINYTCQTIFDSKPPKLARVVLKEMMTNVDIGYKLGSKTSALGIEGGMLAGFIRSAGLGLLMAHDSHAFQRWYSKTDGHEGRALMLKTFGCEPYQIAAAAVQYLGFGPQPAIGAAICIGGLNPTHLEIGPETVMWSAAYSWIEALREGRSYPAQLKYRDFFPEIAPPKEGQRKNRTLEILYTEVAALKRRGSQTKWHLSGIDAAASL